MSNSSFRIAYVSIINDAKSLVANFRHRGHQEAMTPGERRAYQRLVNFLDDHDQDPAFHRTTRHGNSTCRSVEANRLGITITDDYDCWRATCPHGKCFDNDLHELVEHYNGRDERAPALRELLTRTSEYDSLMVCDKAHLNLCDWCHIQNV